MRLLVCGSRTYDNQLQMYAVLNGLTVSGWRRPGEGITLVHGAARGADTLAAGYASIAPVYDPEAHPADWDKHGKAAGFIRNQEMLDTGIDLVIAFFDKVETNGTADTCRRAEAMGIPVWKIFSG